MKDKMRRQWERKNIFTCGNNALRKRFLSLNVLSTDIICFRLDFKSQFIASSLEGHFTFQTKYHISNSIQTF